MAGGETGLDNLLDAGLDLIDGGIFADGYDAVGLTGGDGLVGCVDALVEKIALALEAVFVGAGGGGRGAGCGCGHDGGRWRARGAGGW